jgi:hypothetical protein
MRTPQSPDGAPAASAGPLRILHLEADPSDAKRVASQLRATGHTCDVVVASTRHAFEGALSNGRDDVIFSGNGLLVESRESPAPEVSPS